MRGMVAQLLLLSVYMFTLTLVCGVCLYNYHYYQCGILATVQLSLSLSLSLSILPAQPSHVCLLVISFVEQRLCVTTVVKILVLSTVNV